MTFVIPHITQVMCGITNLHKTLVIPQNVSDTTRHDVRDTTQHTQVITKEIAMEAFAGRSNVSRAWAYEFSAPRGNGSISLV